MQEFWVFGYGSLMWRPGFAHEETRPALLHGMSRRLCVYSHFHRGCKKRPGLVLGLDRGGSCRGVAFRVNANLWPDVLSYLREREQVTHIYHEVTRRIRLVDEPGREVTALTYVVDRAHSQYAGLLPISEQQAIVRQSIGQSGPNPEYVLSTVEHLRSMGIFDRQLEAVASGL